MSVALELYQALNEATDDKTRAKLIAEAFEAFEERYPHLPDLATQGHVRESELRLQKEIKEVELRLQKEIKEIDLKIKDVDVKLSQVEVNLQKAINAQTRWMLGGFAALGVIFKLADVLIK